MQVLDIAINIATSDLKRSRQFYEGLGLEVLEKFSNHQAFALKLSNSIFVMVLHQDFFKTFTKKPVADASIAPETILAVRLASKQDVDNQYNLALELGASAAYHEDHGFMYGRAFCDLDGHIWEFYWMQAADTLQ